MYLKKVILILLGVSFFVTYSHLFAQQSPLNTLAVKASKRLVMDIKLLSTGRLVAIGERGHILVSDDQGVTWQQKLVETEALLTKLFFIDDQQGWAVGHQQTILKTSNAGDSWQVQHSSNNLDQPALFDIWFKDKLYGFTVGAYGLFLSTDDGGKSWREVYQQNLEDEEIGGFPHFYSITFDQSSKQLFIAGELGLLAKSGDFGVSWEKGNSPYHGSFFNIAALSNGHLLVMGLRGHLFSSNDSGASWSEIKTNTISGLQELVLLPNNKLLIVGSDGTQLLSDNLGKSFRLIQRADRAHLSNAVSLANQEVLLAGINGIIKTKL